jgi:uncharacterized membrane protein
VLRFHYGKPRVYHIRNRIGRKSLGAVGDLTEFGLNEDFIDDVTTQLNPGDTALIVEVDEGSTEPTDRVVSQYGGRIYRSELV